MSELENNNTLAGRVYSKRIEIVLLVLMTCLIIGFIAEGVMPRSDTFGPVYIMEWLCVGLGLSLFTGTGFLCWWLWYEIFGKWRGSNR